jgi:riboflavin kinase
MIIEGTIVSGFKEGSKYIKIYKEKIKNLINKDLYEGTLNVKTSLNIKNLKFKNLLKIDGFDSYGAVYLTNCKINGEDAYIIIPEKTKHKNVFEIVSDVSLREKYNFKDGDKVFIEFETID